MSCLKIWIDTLNHSWLHILLIRRIVRFGSDLPPQATGRLLVSYGCGGGNGIQCCWRRSVRPRSKASATLAYPAPRTDDDETAPFSGWKVRFSLVFLHVVLCINKYICIISPAGTRIPSA